MSSGVAALAAQQRRILGARDQTGRRRTSGGAGFRCRGACSCAIRKCCCAETRRSAASGKRTSVRRAIRIPPWPRCATSSSRTPSGTIRIALLARKPRQHAADGLDREAEEVADVLPGHRQGYRDGRRRQPRPALAQADQEGRDLLLRGAAAENHHLLLRERQFVARHGMQLAQAGPASRRGNPKTPRAKTGRR